VRVEVDIASIDTVFVATFLDGGLHYGGRRRQIPVGYGVAFIEFDIAKAAISSVFVLKRRGVQSYLP